ncbi:hypothetical protein ACFL4U_01345 [Candidatus Neomarinimicrobiota bacterium]
MNSDTSLQLDRAVYLEEKLNTLVELISEGYGESILEQLILRMEMTVREFQSEIDLMVERLKENAATQEELLERIKKQELAASQTELRFVGGAEEEVPEWERKLAELERSAE